MSFSCEHGAECHNGNIVSMASAPEASRAWLLVEQPGPWPHEAAGAAMPAPLGALLTAAGNSGIRVQLIRKPGRRQVGDARTVFLGWTAGREPWLRRATVSASAPELTERDLKDLAAGSARSSGTSSSGTSSFGSPAGAPVFLVCTHAKRSLCCSRYGVPLARALAVRHPGRVWETTHVGGHRFAANLVILPHGLFYGPVGLETATAAIGAYQRGAVALDRYRGRAGTPRPGQEADHARLASAGSLPVEGLALGVVRERGCDRGEDGSLRLGLPCLADLSG